LLVLLPASSKRTPGNAAIVFTMGVVSVKAARGGAAAPTSTVFGARSERALLKPGLGIGMSDAAVGRRIVGRAGMWVRANPTGWRLLQ